MEQHSIITQVSRDDEALSCQPTSDKGNTERSSVVASLLNRGDDGNCFACASYRNMAKHISTAKACTSLPFGRIARLVPDLYLWQ